MAFGEPPQEDDCCIPQHEYMNFEQFRIGPTAEQMIYELAELCRPRGLASPLKHPIDAFLEKYIQFKPFTFTIEPVEKEGDDEPYEQTGFGD